MTTRNLVLLLAPFAAATVRADLILSASMVYVEQGGTIGAGNIGTAGTAFAKDLIGGGAFAPSHTIPNVNNGSFGNGSSWIGDSAPSYVGIGYGVSQTIAGFAFGRSNVTSGDPCGGGVCTDRSAGTYTIEYTTDPNPVANHATAAWNTIGTMTIASGGGVLTSSWLRHRYNLSTPVNATGFRVVTPGGAAVDELEIFTTPAAASIGALVTTPAPGYSMSWNGNDGVHSSATGLAPNNLALASNGGSAIASGALGPQISVPFHLISNLNDGRYGNANSWIGGDGDPGPAFAGAMLGGLYDVTSFAFGRDNGLDVANGDCCGGQLTDRSMGSYTVQRTLDGTSWENIGTIDFNYGQDGGVGGEFTPYLRHEFDLSDGSGGILARGLRLLVPSTGIGSGTAIDEFEIYGTPVPEPGSGAMLGLGAALVLRRRRRA